MNTKQARRARRIAKQVIREREQYFRYITEGTFSTDYSLLAPRPLPFEQFMERVARPVNRRIEQQFEWWTQ